MIRAQRAEHSAAKRISEWIESGLTDEQIAVATGYSVEFVARVRARLAEESDAK